MRGAGDPAQLAQLEAVLRDVLAATPVALSIGRVPRVVADAVLRPDPSARAALARVWVDLTDAEVALLYIVDGPWERGLVRRVPLGPTGVDEVVREQLGYIVGTSVEAMLSGARIGVARAQVARTFGLEEPAPTAPPRRRAAPRVTAPRITAPRMTAPPPAAEARRPPAASDAAAMGERAASAPASSAAIGLRIDAGHTVWLLDPSVPTHGLALSVGVAGRVDDPAALWFGARLQGQYRFRHIVGGEPVSAELELGGLRLLATLAHRPLPAVELAVGLGAALQILHVTPRAAPNPDGLALAAARTRVDPAASAALELTLRPLEGVSVGLRAGLDVDLLGARFVVERGAGEEVVFAPAVVRPWAQGFAGAEL